MGGRALVLAVAATTAAALLCSCSSSPASSADRGASLAVTGYRSVSIFGSSHPATVTLTGSRLRWLTAAVGTLNEIQPPRCEENAVLYSFRDVRRGRTVWSGDDLLCPSPGWLRFGPLERSLENACGFLRDVASLFPAGAATGSARLVRQTCRRRAAS